MQTQNEVKLTGLNELAMADLQFLAGGTPIIICKEVIQHPDGTITCDGKKPF